MNNAIELIKEALESTDVVLYNRVCNGEIDFTEAGDVFHSYLAYEIIRALKVALEELKEES